MSSEANKFLCAILSAILVLLLSSFISELLYHSKEDKNKLSYVVEEELSNEIEVDEKVSSKELTISSKSIEKLLINASLEEGEKFVNKNCVLVIVLNFLLKIKLVLLWLNL